MQNHTPPDTNETPYNRLRNEVMDEFGTRFAQLEGRVQLLEQGRGRLAHGTHIPGGGGYGSPGSF